MTDTEPRTLPHVEGIRNPRRAAVGHALLAEIKAQGLTVRCVSKITDGHPTLSIKYPRLRAIVNGDCDVQVDELAFLCDVLAIGFDDLIAAATEHHTK